MTLLVMTRGDKIAFTASMTDGTGVNPADLTGITITFTAKRRKTDTDAQAIIVRSTADGIVTDYDPTTGTATITLDPEDTELLTAHVVARSLYWDVQIDDMAGDVRTPLKGLLAIDADITRTSGAS
jgi:hypothetical protein